jgi:hypothetical protein
MTLQMIRGELWYVAPLEFHDIFTWNSTKTSPGFVMVHGEDPNKQVIVKTGLQMRYTPGAYFGSNLERMLWYKGEYVSRDLRDFTFELDEDLKPYWVLTAYHPTIGWDAHVVDGVVIVDPVSGDSKLYKVGETPAWVDRVFPQEIVKNYLEWNGLYIHGWWNQAFGGNTDTYKPETPLIIYGSDGLPYWVVAVTSNSGKDDSMIGLVYTCSRTGKSVRYHAVGGTEEAIVNLVNSKVSYQKLHGSGPVLYNIYGTMTSIVPILGENHSFQGVVFVDVANNRLGEPGNTVETAFMNYQKILTTGGQQISPEKMSDLTTITVKADRVVALTKGNEVTFYIYVEGHSHVFTATVELSPAKLPVTRDGDTLVLKFVDAPGDRVMLVGFDNLSVQLTPSPNQVDVRSRTEERRDQEQKKKDAAAILDKLSKMPEEDLLKLQGALKDQH